MLYERGHQQGAPEGGFSVLQSNAHNPTNVQNSNKHPDNGHMDNGQPDNGDMDVLLNDEETDLLHRENSGGTQNLSV